MGLLSLLLAQEVTPPILMAIWVAFCESVHQTHATGKKGERESKRE